MISSPWTQTIASTKQTATTPILDTRIQTLTMQTLRDTCVTFVYSPPQAAQCSSSIHVLTNLSNGWFVLGRSSLLTLLWSSFAHVSCLYLVQWQHRGQPSCGGCHKLPSVQSFHCPCNLGWCHCILHIHHLLSGQLFSSMTPNNGKTSITNTHTHTHINMLRTERSILRTQSTAHTSTLAHKHATVHWQHMHCVWCPWAGLGISLLQWRLHPNCIGKHNPSCSPEMMQLPLCQKHFLLRLGTPQLSCLERLEWLPHPYEWLERLPHHS